MDFFFLLFAHLAQVLVESCEHQSVVTALSSVVRALEEGN
jgi:hypothetical protein